MLQITHQIEDEKIEEIIQIEELSKEIYMLLKGDIENIELNPNAESEFKKELKEKFEEKIIGQEKAKKALIEAVFNNIAPIRSKKGPLGVFFFAGPSGVGKTQITKVLADILLGSEDYITKIDCAEFSEDHTARNLFGAPKSYVGYGEPTPLNDINLFKSYQESKKRNLIHRQISRLNSFSILLFDEIEKAHPNIHQSLLGAMADGKIRFPSGKESDNKLKYSQETDLSNTIIIFTSNVGNREAIKKSIGFVQEKNDEGQKADYKNSFNKVFSPEFIGRVDEFITFENLNKEDLFEILKKEVLDISRHFGVLEGNFKLNISDEVLKKIVDRSFSKKYGARPVINDFTKTVEADINNIINSGQLESLFDIKSFSFVINVDLDHNGNFKYTLSKYNEISEENDIKNSLDKLKKYIEYSFKEDIDIDDKINKIEEKLLSKFDKKEISIIRNKIYSNMILDFDMIHEFDDYEGISISNKEEKNLLGKFGRRNTKTIVDRKLEIYKGKFNYNNDKFIEYIGEIFVMVEELNGEVLNQKQIKEIMKMIDAYKKSRKK
ncbi:AAA family ATPase [Candidatus Vampirococcus lugosii]|uniref:ATP-dependent Clp protease, ATP-binding subunit ClpC n=1 Tax=Candidatus Vampirococcus lugosii TaxID=2789015 RepID=A0ABS5QJN7_9BACT|nr:ATP-dependent Clp protease, ATP-binding subunit ClpC [Candidatus Vampirococcus lugosii]